MVSVFICGSNGTTGLRLGERLASRQDIQLVQIDEERRKDPREVKRCMDASDISFLCLPDDAARNIVKLSGNMRIIDTSTAHRTAPDWVYGFPEYSAAHRSAIGSATRVSVPGCHASGFIALVHPLVAAGILPPDYPLTCHSLTGYSGGGKAMIQEYQQTAAPGMYFPAKQYALNQNHKHLPEMKSICGLSDYPVFVPAVEHFYSGMLVNIFLHTGLLKGRSNKKQIWNCLKQHYAGSGLIGVMDLEQEDVLDAAAMAGADNMEIYVAGNDERITLTARFDNLGKGASGAAVQCLNLMIGANETEGLVLK